MNLRVGTSGYSYKEWKGTFYPQSLPSKQMLRFYGEHFGTVESNHTFRKLPAASVVEAWTREVPGDFQFALKAPMQITHFRRLRDAEEPLTNFYDIAGVLEGRLGPVLFQLPGNFKKDAQRLREFLELLPPEWRSVFEFRHQSWFDDEIFALLRDHHVAMCVAEAESDLEVPLVATADWGYVRLRRTDYSDAELKVWIDRIQKGNWRDSYVFFMHDDAGRGPQMATRFRELAG